MPTSIRLFRGKVWLNTMPGSLSYRVALMALSRLHYLVENHLEKSGCNTLSGTRRSLLDDYGDFRVYLVSDSTLKSRDFLSCLVLAFLIRRLRDSHGQQEYLLLRQLTFITLTHTKMRCSAPFMLRVVRH